MAYDGPGLVAPADYPIRDPRTRPQAVGRVKNAVGFPEIGGFTSSRKLTGHDSTFQHVQAPESVKPASPSAKGNSGMRKR